MAHEVEQMFSVIKTPWHNLGRVVREAPNVEEAIELAGLNWRVDLKDLQTIEGQLEVPARAIVRADTNAVLGVVGPQYVPLQNDKAFEFFNPFLDSKECSLDTAGSLRQGKRIWVLAKLNRDPIVVAKDDTVQKYLLLSNSHEGYSAVRVGFTPVRVVCANTLAMATNDSRSSLLKVRHKSNLHTSLEQVQDIVNIANQTFDATAEQYRLLAKSAVSAKDVKKYVQRVFFDEKAKTESERMKLRREKMTETILNLFETGRGNAARAVNGTYWALYNGATEYLSHEALSNDDQRLTSLWFGSNLERNKKAFEVALEMAVG